MKPEPIVIHEVKTGRQELMEQAIALLRKKSDLQDKRIAQLELHFLSQSVAFESVNH